MGKRNNFKSGDYVSCKKLNGEEFLGVYSHEYDCGDHCVSDKDGRLFCVNMEDCQLANEYETEEIKKFLKTKKKELEEMLEEE